MNVIPQPRIAPAARLSIGTCLGFGVGTVGVSIMLNAVTQYFPAFMTTVLGQSTAIAGYLMMGSKLYDVVADIVIGRLSDRTRSRWGRRRPYLLIGAAVSAGSFLMLFVPSRMTEGALIAYMAAALVLYSTGYSLFNVPYMTMPSEMTDSFHERTRLISVRTVFVSGGQMLAAAGTAALIQRGGGGGRGYAMMGLVMALIIFAAMAGAFFGTAGARQIPESRSKPRLTGGQIALLLRNRPFVFLAGAKVFQFLGFSSVATTVLLFLLNVLHVGYPGQIKLSLAQNLATAASMPLWVLISGRIGKRRTYLLSGAVYCAAVLSWLGADASVTTLGLLVRGVFSGTGSGGLILLSISMLGDTMAFDRTLTGLHREGLLSGIIAVIEKTAFALGVAIVGVMLKLAGYLPTVGGALTAQPGSATRALYLGYAVIPVVIFAFNAACIYFYDLDERRVQRA